MMFSVAPPTGYHNAHGAPSHTHHSHDSQSMHASAAATTVPVPATSYPAALPAPFLYTLYPDEIGPTANVLISDPAEMQMWKLVGRHVSAQEAEAHGGCVAFVPPNSSLACRTPSYYCVTDCDDDVYGRAAYVHRGSGSDLAMTHLEKTVSLLKRVESATEAGCTEDSQCMSESSVSAKSTPPTHFLTKSNESAEDNNGC